MYSCYSTQRSYGMTLQERHCWNGMHIYLDLYLIVLPKLCPFTPFSDVYYYEAGEPSAGRSQNTLTEKGGSVRVSGHSMQHNGRGRARKLGSHEGLHFT